MTGKLLADLNCGIVINGGRGDMASRTMPGPVSKLAKIAGALSDSGALVTGQGAALTVRKKAQANAGMKGRPRKKAQEARVGVVAGQAVPTVFFYNQETGKRETVPPEVAVATQLYLRGVSQGAIGRQLGKNKATVGRWLDQYGEYVDEQFKVFNAGLIIKEGLDRLVPLALGVQREALEDPTVEMGIRQRVAESVLDRQGGKAVQRVVSDERQEIAITYRIITKDETHE